jgi:hypothetical protein
MQFLRRLIESRPYFNRIPDQKLIASDPGTGGLHIQATRDTEGTYAFVYFPMTDMTARLDLTRLGSRRLHAWWYDPRTGVGTLIGSIDPVTQSEFRTPPYGPDWVLVVDSADANYLPPGLDAWSRREVLSIKEVQRENSTNRLPIGCSPSRVPPRAGAASLRIPPGKSRTQPVRRRPLPQSRRTSTSLS